MPLECDINIVVNGPFWVEVANPEHPFTAMLISRSRGYCLIALATLFVPLAATNAPTWADGRIREFSKATSVSMLSYSELLDKLKRGV